METWTSRGGLAGFGHVPVDAASAGHIEVDRPRAGQGRGGALGIGGAVVAEPGPKEIGEGLVGERGRGEGAGRTAALEDAERGGGVDGGRWQHPGGDAPRGVGGGGALGVADAVQGEQDPVGGQAEGRRQRGGNRCGREGREAAVGAGERDVLGDEPRVDRAEEVDRAVVAGDGEGEGRSGGGGGEQRAQIGRGLPGEEVLELVVDEDALGTQDVDHLVAAGVGVVGGAVAGDGAVDAGRGPEEIGYGLPGKRGGREGGGIAARREDAVDGVVGAARGGQGDVLGAGGTGEEREDEEGAGEREGTERWHAAVEEAEVGAARRLRQTR